MGPTLLLIIVQKQLGELRGSEIQVRFLEGVWEWKCMWVFFYCEEDLHNWGNGLETSKKLEWISFVHVYYVWNACVVAVWLLKLETSQAIGFGWVGVEMMDLFLPSHEESKYVLIQVWNQLRKERSKKEFHGCLVTKQKGQEYGTCIWHFEYYTILDLIRTITFIL